MKTKNLRGKGYSFPNSQEMQMLLEKILTSKVCDKDTTVLKNKFEQLFREEIRNIIQEELNKS